MDLVRIFKSIVVALLLVVFLSLLVSAYANYRVAISTAQLADACSSIANHLALDDLAHVSGKKPAEYVVDPTRLEELPPVLELGGDNYGFSVRISTASGLLAGPTSEPPEGSPVATITLPVAVFDNWRRVPGLLEVRVWRV